MFFKKGNNMTLNKVFFTVLCCSLQLIASDHGGEKAQPTPNSSRSGTPDTIAHGVLGTVPTTLKNVASSLSNLLSQGESPTKEHRSHEDLDILLGGYFLKKLFPHELPKDLQEFVLQHPDILTAVAVSAYAYLDNGLHTKNPDRPNEKTVHDYIKSLGFEIEKLEDDLILLTRTTTDGIKQAWFSVTGTDSVSDAITNIGIGTHMHASDYHNFITSVWADHVAPKLYSENSYCASAFNYMSSLPLNLYHMANMAYLTLSMYGFSKTDHTKDLYTTYFGMVCSAGFVMSAILYSNIIPHALYKLRYKPHTNRLLARIRTRRKELEKEGYTDFFITGHSSGGHGAQILGLLTGLRTFSFNAPGGALKHAQWVYGSTQDKDGIIKPTEDDYRQKILAIITNKDPVSALQHDQDPVQPTQIDLEGDHGFIGPHEINRLYWHCQKQQTGDQDKAASILPKRPPQLSLVFKTIRFLLTPIRLISKATSNFETLQQKFTIELKK